LRLLTATATAWVIGQVFINVGYVIGLLPVTGIQLPLISAGGTSTATTLFMIGLMANAARHEPDAVAALRAGREDRMNRFLRLPLPEAYVPSRVEALQDRLSTRPAAGKPAAKPARKSAGPAKSAKPAKSAAPAKKPAKRAKAGTAHAAPRRSGHDGSASRQRRAAAAQGSGRQGNANGRRSRAMEGQRYG
ncbi:MAG: FtsW/RodA/SpoVE family cell cycle protein, partial [Mycobacterium sp.]